MPRDEKLEHLRRVPLFEKLGTAELERLGQLTDEVEVGLDRVLAEQGTIGHEFFIVLDGRVMVLRGNTPVRELGPGDFFGEIALLTGEDRIADVVAAEPMTLLRLNRDSYDRYLAHAAEVEQQMTRAAMSRTRETTRRMISGN
jgi:CRP/FNR family cyclic AMP-dependent transcriptional regulator